jgi:hypothetical protein
MNSSISNRRLIYGEEVDEEEDYNQDRGHPDDEYDEEEDDLGAAAHLMIMREHHRR